MLKYLSSKWKSWTITLAVVAAVSWWLLSTSLEVVYVTRAEEKTARDIVLGIAEIDEYHLTTIKAERTGIIKESFAERGTKISKGDIVFTMDTEMLELEVERMSINKEHLEKTLELPLVIESRILEAQDEFELKEDRYSQGRMTEEEMIQARRNMQMLDDNLERAKLSQQLRIIRTENDIARNKYSLERMTIASPLDGTVVDVLCRKGDIATQGQPVATVMDHRRRIVVTSSQEDFNKVKVGTPLELRMKAFPDQVFTGQVTQILPRTDPEKKKFRMFIEANLPEDRIIPGLTGESSIIAAERANAIVIPSQAVFEDHVLLVKDNRIQKTKVKVGFKGLLEVEILEGVKKGDIVVTEANNVLPDGQFVKTEWEEAASLR